MALYKVTWQHIVLQTSWDMVFGEPKLAGSGVFVSKHQECGPPTACDVWLRVWVDSLFLRLGTEGWLTSTWWAHSQDRTRGGRALHAV